MDLELQKKIGSPEEMKTWVREKEKKSRCALSPILLRGYKHNAFKKLCKSIAWRLEGGLLFSRTLRDILKCYFKVSIGKYSYFNDWDTSCFPPGLVIGNYTGIHNSIRIYRRDHPIRNLSPHAIFYKSYFGPLLMDTIPSIEDNPLEIGNDVFIGEGVAILPNCKKIGNGSVIGAKALVTKSIPDFAIVGGNPGKIIGYRFNNNIIEKILESQWWDKGLEECVLAMPFMLKEIGNDLSWHPFFK